MFLDKKDEFTRDNLERGRERDSRIKKTSFLLYYWSTGQLCLCWDHGFIPVNCTEKSLFS